MPTERPPLSWGEYIPPEGLRLAAAALVSPSWDGGARAVLLSGPPGAGKTAFALALARALQAELVFHQLHAWSDSDELFVGVDVASAVAGDAGSVRQDGVLARAAKASVAAQEDGFAVLCLDEVDKTSERTEALLLDFLQSGRVPIRPGVHLQADLKRLIVVMTTNDQRPLSDALLRRVRRVSVPPMGAELMVKILSRQGVAQAGVIRTAVKAVRAISERDGFAVSLQEVSHAVQEAWGLAGSFGDLRHVFAAWAARTEGGRQAVLNGVWDQTLAPVWAEIASARRNEHVS